MIDKDGEYVGEEILKVAFLGFEREEATCYYGGPSAKASFTITIIFFFVRRRTIVYKKGINPNWA